RLDLAGRLPAVQHRQAHIHQNQVRRLAPGQRHALLAVAGSDDLEPAPLQPAYEDALVHFVVLDHQDLRHILFSLRSAGRVMIKVEPTPGWLLTLTSPPNIWANCRVMARPNPVPPYRRVVDGSAWLKAWNSRPTCSSLIPMPVSHTVK